MAVTWRLCAVVRYLELPLSRPLSDCLKGQLVIEFPVMVVTTEEHAEQYRTDTIQGTLAAPGVISLLARMAAVGGRP